VTTCLLLLVLLGAGAPGPAESLAGLLELTLVDQYGESGRVADHVERPTVVIIVTARRLRNVKPWERALRDRFPEIDIVRITDVPEDSPATVENVSAKLRERVPEGVSVLIDMDRRWAAALGLDTSRPNLLVLDADGGLVASVRGRHDPELEDQVATAITDLMGGE
jgi:hypothetical protein